LTTKRSRFTNTRGGQQKRIKYIRKRHITRPGIATIAKATLQKAAAAAASQQHQQKTRNYTTLQISCFQAAART